MTTGRRLLPLTVISTYLLFLLGIYTAAIGAGLTCGARWPLCDGAVFGLFPANWTSFVEWFHRLIAMVTGFLILGSWILVWRSKADRRALLSFTLAVVLLPPQVWLGAQTVLQYDLLSLTAHFLTPLAIFAGVLIGTSSVFALEPLITRYRRMLLMLSLGLFFPFVFLTPQFLVIHTGAIQVIYYGLGLAIFALLILVTFGGQYREATTLRLITGSVLFLLIIQLLAGRLLRSSTVHSADWIAGFLTVPVLVVGIWVAHRIESTRAPYAH